MGRKTISLDELDKFEVDETTSELYWQGQKVVTEIRLPRALNAAVFLGAIGSVLSALIAGIGLLAALGVIKTPPPITVEVTVVMDGKVVGTGHSP